MERGSRLALEATTGWRFMVEELQAVGASVHLAEPAETSALRGPKKRAKTDCACAPLSHAAGKAPKELVAAMTPESAYRPGRKDVRVYEVRGARLLARMGRR